MILSSLFIDTRNFFYPNFNSRIAEIKWYLAAVVLEQLDAHCLFLAHRNSFLPSIRRARLFLLLACLLIQQGQNQPAKEEGQFAAALAE